jgi:hypothetical protein
VQIEIALQVALKDNDTIYMLPVPAELSAPEGKQMVKPKVSTACLCTAYCEHDWGFSPNRTIVRPSRIRCRKGTGSYCSRISSR